MRAILVSDFSRTPQTWAKRSCQVVGVRLKSDTRRRETPADRNQAVATAKRAPLGICPRPRRGIRAAGFRFCGFLLANKKMHRVGLAVVQFTRSTSAEATAGRESLQPSALRARCTWKPSASFRECQARRSDKCRKYRQIAFPGELALADAAGTVIPRRNAPRPALLRPASRLTSAEATACRRAINLGRSVLGAIRTLRARGTGVKHARTAIPALCDLFFTMRTYLRQALCALPKQDQGFAEPGALSSTSPADLPLPRTAFRESFVLLASRARRSGNLRFAAHPCKGIRRRKGRKLRTSGDT